MKQSNKFLKSAITIYGIAWFATLRTFFPNPKTTLKVDKKTTVNSNINGVFYVFIYFTNIYLIQTEA